MLETKKMFFKNTFWFGEVTIFKSTWGARSRGFLNFLLNQSVFVPVRLCVSNSLTKQITLETWNLVHTIPLSNFNFFFKKGPCSRQASKTSASHTWLTTHLLDCLLVTIVLLVLDGCIKGDGFSYFQHVYCGSLTNFK